MAKLITDTRVLTNEVRASYEHLLRPSSFGGQDPKYSVSAIIPKSDKATLMVIEQAIKNAEQRGIEKYGKAFKSPKLKNPLHDGDLDKKGDDAYSNAYFINCSNKERPRVLDMNKDEITDSTEIYSGIYGKVIVNFYPYSAPGNVGVAASLMAFQKTKDGEALGGAHVSVDDFDDDEDDLLQ